MDSATLSDLYAWFDDYAKSFYTCDEEIQPKILEKEKHSIIVAGHARDLAKSLGLSADETRLAEVIGLCHDVGRFKQVTLYRTFRDRESVNHGFLGAEEMASQGLDTRLNPRQWSIISFAVRWHNAVAIPEQSDPDLRMHARIIRDTDKLDIFRVLPPEPPSGKCSPGLEADLIAGRLLYYEDIKTADDRKLIMLSWIFDTNFPWTLQEMVKRRHLDRLLDSLPASSVLPAIRRKVAATIAARLASFGGTPSASQTPNCKF